MYTFLFTDIFERENFGIEMIYVNVEVGLFSSVCIEYGGENLTFMM